MKREERDGPTILLYSLWQAALVIAWPSGVVYLNQTGGYSCGQRAQEGVVVPLMDIPLDTGRCPLEYALSSLEWISTGLGIDDDRATEIDEILGRFRATQGISVDRERQADSEEAWVYVVAAPADLAEYQRFGSCRGVLTWPNSD